MPMTRASFVAAMATLLLGTSALAQPAQPPPAESERDARARTHFEAGNSYYQTGDYEGAIREFQVAYELSGRTALLFNLANAYERLGRLAEAVDHMQRFLDGTPDAPNRAMLEERLTHMRERLAAQGQSGSSTGGTSATGTAGAGAGSSGGAGAATTSPSASSGPSAAAIVSLVVSGAALASGILFWRLTAGEYADLEDTCGPDCTDDDVATLGTYALVADLSFGVSLATAILGGVLLFSSGGERPVSVSIGDGPGLSLHAVF